MIKLSFIFNPKYWPIWLGAGALWLAVQLPYRWQLFIGRALGRIALPFSSHRRRIAQINLKLCFPKLSDQELNKLLTQCFESAGIAIFETVIAWWMPERRFNKLISIEGLNYLNETLAKKHGALILLGHFTTLELAGRILAAHTRYSGVYRKHKNPVFEWMMSTIREKYIHQAIGREDVRQFMHAFKENIPILYAPDQDYGRKHSIFVPFFGIPAATVTSTARIAKIAKTSVLPYIVYRRDDGLGYIAKIYPPLENYPTDDPYQDALRINQLIEQAILKNPAQYLWQHRRFKTRPEGEASLY